MVFKVENIEGEAELLVTKEYGPDNCDLTVEQLTEVFVVIYTYLKKGVKEPVEIYTFTTDFDQAFKRFKLLPACKCLLKRFLTDDEALIDLAIKGTKPKVEMTDELNTEEMTVQIKEIMDRFNDDEVDRGGITVRELRDDELDILKENKDKTENIYTIWNQPELENQLIGNGEQREHCECGEEERKEGTKDTGGEDIQDYQPEQSEVLHWVNNITPGETVHTTSPSKEELGEEEQVCKKVSKL
jgi:hypothetical protein